MLCDNDSCANITALAKSLCRKKFAVFRIVYAKNLMSIRLILYSISRCMSSLCVRSRRHADERDRRWQRRPGGQVPVSGVRSIFGKTQVRRIHYQQAYYSYRCSLFKDVRISFFVLFVLQFMYHIRERERISKFIHPISEENKTFANK